MQPLTSLDASFVLAETPGRPMHISSISIYDPSTAETGPEGSPLRFKQIMERFRDAIYDVPMLRRRLVEVPANLDFPYWIEDPDFDIEFHVRHIALPRPGDWRQFFIQLARLHSRQLDMSRPLWEVYVIEGLNHLEGIPTGSFAVVQKVHHSAMDGVSVKNMFLALHDTQPIPRKHLQRKEPLLRESRPGMVSMMIKASQRAARRPLRFGRVLVQATDSLRRAAQEEKRGEIGPVIEAPHCRFSGSTSAYRAVTAAEFDLEEFLQLKRLRSHITLNDLALSVFGGALRQYLLDKHELPEQPLVAQVPVDIRDCASQLQGGNQINTLNASCGSDIEDPIARLDAVRASMQDGKKRLEIMGASLLHDGIEALGPQATAMLYNLIYNSGSAGLLDKVMPESPNLVFSNMPGPADAAYFGGAQLVWGTGLGPIMPTNGLFVAVSSICGKLIYGITACREMMPDPDVFQQCLYESYEKTKRALSAAAIVEGSGAGGRRKVSSKRKLNRD
ncbi:wax ester/triacylglycerol synthase family O-acyltransferase [Seongchinamella sediminis]|uniref:diacylglycerol O-acyltransferase n=1 Tax=Seongchinamella sediminis TaxID=2283635 RepID=A0A3L7DWA9_9GAMM|nr:wax ester/triacylglycerol synthase family O-acyltransferase [Seongchinamella sediminis]RLQ20231.1 wax ester/triacylglycerol synthase family O-acyltransferase [Seongchinamella sediminis]